MAILRIIGDVHGQIKPDDVYSQGRRSYLEIIADAPCSVQVGDMGDELTYRQLIDLVDPESHRFFPGNHDHYHVLPPHCLGDFGSATLGGVEFFFARGARSSDREKLVRLGTQLGKTLWFEQEELTDAEMHAAAAAYAQARPAVVLSHDAPAEIAGLAWQHARRSRAPVADAAFRPSRTNAFLEQLLEVHAPRLWLFGHHHHDWQYRDGGTLFVCAGELSHVDIDAAGNVCGA